MKKHYDKFINDALKANKELRFYIKNKLTEDDFIDTNTIGEGGDSTKKIDLIAENIFVKYLSKFGDIFSEESGLITHNKMSKHKSNRYLFDNSVIIIDPLDGSDNFVAKFPYYGTSISLCVNNITVAALVYNLVDGKYVVKTPYAKNIFHSMCINTNFGIFERAYTAPNIALELHKQNIKFRSPGATALSLANSINYQFFLFAGRPRRFDVDAGIFISNELNIYQNDNFLLVSKDKRIFDIIKDIIKRY